MVLPEHEEGRPGGAASTISTPVKNDSILPSWLRRRVRQQRADGVRRNDTLPSLPTRPCRPAHVEVDPAAGKALIVGPCVADVLSAGGLRPEWSTSRRGWVIPLSRLEDVWDALEFVGYTPRLAGRWSG